jgi:hypothetical protein
MTKRLTAWAAIVVATLTMMAESAAPQTSRISDDPLRHGHALLVGISHYHDAGWPTLDDVPLQIDALHRGLANHFDTVDVVQDLDTERLRAALLQFMRTYGNDDTGRLFIYYAGHGYTELIQQFDESRGYITGTNTPAIHANTAKEFAAARLEAISMREIRTLLSDVVAHDVLFVFDSCFAGTVFTTRARTEPPPRALTPDVVAKLMEKPARQFITAGRANERVPAHSPIPDLLLAALDGAASNYQRDILSATELGVYLQNQLILRPEYRITPQVGKLQETAFAEGEFFFRVAPSPRAPPQRSSSGRGDSPIEPLARPPTESLSALPLREPDSVDPMDSAYRAGITGTWAGWHQCGASKVGTSATISVDIAGNVTGYREFHPTAADPARASGSFQLSGTYQRTTGAVSLIAGAWMNRPPGYGKCDFVGNVDPTGKVISGTSPSCGCGQFELRRQ